MKRVRASDVLLLLHAEADRTGDERFRVSAGALRNWVYRGHITRGAGGYDLAEILAYLERRDDDHQRASLTAGQDQCDAM
ncbi:hypothetical protein [Amycolatopsis taiwanensis]|uniref:hypothetical protein n=1 Tax=Amycolatopsis taiwanensis TaxID=342230 RepID=UPI0004802CBE|nr:hypothetical protein [Amycolatopsis taiwanensis]